MSAIDDALTDVWESISELLASDARAELAALRDENLKLSAGDYLLREIGEALNCAPDAMILQCIVELRASEQYWQQTAETERANAAEQRERAEILRAMVEAQARQIESLEAIIATGNKHIDNMLAATAPAPQAQPAQRVNAEVESE